MASQRQVLNSLEAALRHLVDVIDVMSSGQHAMTPSDESAMFEEALQMAREALASSPPEASEDRVEMQREAVLEMAGVPCYHDAISGEYDGFRCSACVEKTALVDALIAAVRVAENEQEGDWLASDRY